MPKKTIEERIIKLAKIMDKKWKIGANASTDYQWWLSAVEYLYNKEELRFVDEVVEAVRHADDIDGREYRDSLDEGIGLAIDAIKNLKSKSVKVSDWLLSMPTSITGPIGPPIEEEQDG